VEADPQVLKRGLVARELTCFVALEKLLRHQIAPASADAACARDPLDRVQVA